MCRGPCSKWPACGEQRTTCESRVSPSPKWNLKSNPSHCARWWVPLSNNPPHWLLSLIILKKKSIFQVCQKIFVIFTKVYLYTSLWVYSRWHEGWKKMADSTPAGVTHSYIWLSRVLWIEIICSGKAESDFNLRAVPPVHKILYIFCQFC